MRKIAGWTILVAFFGGLIALTGQEFGWSGAALMWGGGVSGACLLALAVKWTLD